MNEERAAHLVREPNPSGIPSRWLRFLYRMAKLQGGNVYTITVIVPREPDGEPQWAISANAPIENQR